MSIEQEFPPENHVVFEQDLTRLYTDLRTRALIMERALRRVANLNPDAGEIGAGMLATIVAEARHALNLTKQ